MSWESLIEFSIGNLGVDWITLVMFLTVITHLIFMAKEVRIGLMLLLLSFTAEFMWFHSVGADTFKITLALFATVAMLALSLFVSYRRQGSQGAVY